MSSSSSRSGAPDNPQSAPPLERKVISQAETASTRGPQEMQNVPVHALPGARPGLPNTQETPESRTHDDSVAHLDRSVSPLHGAPQMPIEAAPSPAYSQTYGQVDFSQDGFDTNARVANDGRVNININQKSRRLSELLVPALRSQIKLQQGHEVSPVLIPTALSGQFGQLPPPYMNVVIHVVGSRGDVQPFVALGKVLKENYGHRVRLATHPTFRGFVEENGLEFFSIGGDPAELMAFMVKNPGLMPGIESLRAGDVGKRRKGMYEIVQGCWRSCIEAGDGTGMRASDDSLESRSSLDSGICMDSDPSARPFVADAIIANPPSFAHVHCAEKLGIPLHLMFTMPWSPTQAFPHPLANVQSSNADASITNFVSYALVEMMTWQGLGDVINRFREDSLGLEPVSLMWAPGMASRLRIPYTYCWSPALIPKPKDWGPHISISGFYFLSLANNFTPAPELAAFLAAGPPPIYIGFGSIVVDNPNAMTKLIFEAVKKTGQRALVSKGWGGFGADAMGVPDGVFMLGNVPHDWLFQHVSCVVHHGGAGTTAAGIAMGKPTVIVPFFGDQPFWGAMVAKAGAGPLPVPNKHLTADNLAAAIREALQPSALQRAQELGATIKSENGTHVGAQSFHGKLNVDSLRCLLAPNRSAAWRVKRTHIRLSPFAATTLGHEGLLDINDLKLYRPMEYDSEDGPWDPISGGASALLGTLGSLAMGFADFPVEILKALRIKPSEASKSGISSQQTTKSRATEPLVEHANQIPPVTSSAEVQPKSVNSPGIISESTKDDINLSANIVHTSDVLEPQKPRTSHDLTGYDHHRSNSPFSGFLHRSSTSHTQNSSIPRSRSDLDSGIETPSPQHLHRSFSGNQAGQISLEAALGAGKGIGRIVGAGLKSPMDFTLSLARGFHNAPKLYGDESVRQADKITGIQSGLKAAGKEFGLGFYDGISGLITQPLDGAKKEGVTGLIKGFGKGIGGVVLKPGAAIWGLPGYTFMGVYKEFQKLFGSSVQNYIIAARTTQGYEEWRKSSLEDRLTVVRRWHDIQSEIVKEKQEARHNSFSTPQGFLKSKRTSCDERKKSRDTKKKEKKDRRHDGTHEVHNYSRASGSPLHHARTFPDDNVLNSDNSTFEEAIQTSVAATSQGDPEQDKLIERAIRASVRELQSASREGDKGEAVARAIKASIAEATGTRTGGKAGQSPPTLDDVNDRKEQLRVALHRSVSIQDEAGSREKHDPLSSIDFDDSGIDTDDDENIKSAIDRSQRDISELTGEEDIEYRKALEESRKAHEKYELEIANVKAEEESMLRMAKSLSLMEGNSED